MRFDPFWNDLRSDVPLRFLNWSRNVAQGREFLTRVELVYQTFQPHLLLIRPRMFSFYLIKFGLASCLVLFCIV